MNAANKAGAELIWLDIDDEFLFDNRETRLAFIDAFRIADPEVVFCHWCNDYNPDHSTSGRIVDDCIHMASVPNIVTEHEPVTGIPHVYFMDTIAGVNFEPEMYVDISETFPGKIELVACHKSQNAWMKDLFGYEMEAFLEIPAKFRGAPGGCTHGGGVPSLSSLGAHIHGTLSAGRPCE